MKHRETEFPLTHHDISMAMDALRSLRNQHINNTKSMNALRVLVKLLYKIDQARTRHNDQKSWDETLSRLDDPKHQEFLDWWYK